MLLLLLGAPALAQPLSIQARTTVEQLTVQISGAAQAPPVVWARGDLVLVRLPKTKAARARVELGSPAVRRASVQPAKDGGVLLRLRMQASLGRAARAVVARRLGPLVELNVPLQVGADADRPLAVQFPPRRVRLVPVAPASAAQAAPPSTAPKPAQPPRPLKTQPITRAPSPWRLVGLGGALLLALGIAVAAWVRRRGQPPSGLAVQGQVRLGAGQAVTLVEVDGVKLLVANDEGGSRVLKRWRVDVAGPTEGGLSPELAETLRRLGQL